ncbi:putative cyanidin 3-O-rutinoside 5-O-glucosyltransferase [Dioscorea sansibarensis]
MEYETKKHRPVSTHSYKTSPQAHDQHSTDRPAMAGKQRHHFLFITASYQGHINPTLHFAEHLATSTGAAVTFSTTVFAHRRMFTSTTPNCDQDLITGGLVTFIPYSDGYDDGYKSEPSMFTEKFHSYV